MNRVLFWLFLGLVAHTVTVAKGGETVIDSMSPAYRQAVDLCLFHRFAEAEKLLKQIIGDSNRGNREAARNLLLEEIYFRRNQYQSYIDFCDSTNQTGPNLDLAKLLVGRPAPNFILTDDSIQVPLRVRKWAIVVVLVNGKAYRFILDTGAERTVISKRLARELSLPRLLNVPLHNILNQTINSGLYHLDTLRVGKLVVTKLPVWQTSMAGFQADGLLGWDILQQFSFTIDYSAQRLVLQKPVIQSDLPRNLLGISRPLLIIHSKSGNQLNLFLDTGSNYGISLTPIGVTKIGNYRIGHRLGLQSGLGGRFRISWERIVKQTAIEMNKYPVTLKRTYIEPIDEIVCSILKDGSVGSKQFRRGKLKIDYLNNHFDYNE